MSTKSSRPSQTRADAPQTHVSTLVAPAGAFDIAGAFQAGAKSAASGAALCTDSLETYFRKNPPKPDYKLGIHTRAIVAELQTVLERVRKAGNYSLQTR